MIVKNIFPILDHIIVSDINFGEQKTKSGIVLRSDNGKSEGVKPRWGKVFAVGPDQRDVKIGDWILIEHGRWTRGVELSIENEDNKIELFRIDPDGILLIADEKPDDLELGAYATPTKPGMADFSF